RRLSAAGLEVLTTDRRIIDIALEFCYDSPDSFTKAFTRFHGLTPAALRKSGGAVRSFAPLRIKVTLEGGQNMDCKIMKKDAFTVLCRAKTFKYEDGAVEVPKFWTEHFSTGGGKEICGMYGINLDESMGGNEFEYLIADNYDPTREIPEGFVTRTIPAHTWAVFPCTGRMPQALQGLNQQIFSQWLPTNPDYKIAAGINVEMYSDASKFEKGAQDQDYYCEVWLPVEKK
uniref:effector binding domain-containing protein n=1 Tax=uncultured Ruthenibacterium sp. TaxID=1905347 RepID=UPI00349EE2BB